MVGRSKNRWANLSEEGMDQENGYEDVVMVDAFSISHLPSLLPSSYSSYSSRYLHAYPGASINGLQTTKARNLLNFDILADTRNPSELLIVSN
jgi:hypothetical protein